MTGTMHGVLIYRLQDKLKARGVHVDYSSLALSLLQALMQANEDIPQGAIVEFPTGQGYRKL